jgi:outer membrane biosynthesis protein TonB
MGAKALWARPPNPVSKRSDALCGWEQSMTTNCAGNRSTSRFVLAVAMGLSLNSVDHLRAFAAEVVADQNKTQALHPGEKATARPGVCEREAEQLVGQKPVLIGRSVRAPKKLRDFPPKYPELPPNTRASGVWLGEILINNSGKIARVWSLREVRFVPPFPAFKSAITDAIQQWEFEPLLARGTPVPVCMTVTVNINWQ